jgi:hypothetical protein
LQEKNKFTTTKPVLQKILKGNIHTEEQDKVNHENKGKINLTRQVYKQIKNQAVLNTTKTTKLQESLYGHSILKLNVNGLNSLIKNSLAL